MKNNTTIVRQGDVLLIRVAKPKEKGTALKGEHGRLILARGEATGHHHSVAMADAELMAANGITYLDVRKAMTMLTHQEHAPIRLKRGTYRVVTQREYHPKAIRKVAD
jgi:hypothetical protein